MPEKASGWVVGYPMGMYKGGEITAFLRSRTVMCLGFREGVKMARVMIS